MGDAARVIEWNGVDLPPELAEMFAVLPPGRYRLEAVAEDGGFELTEEQEAGIEAARRSVREGRVLTPAELDDRIRLRIEAARAR